VDRAQTEAARQVIGVQLGTEVAITPEAGRLTAPMSNTSITPELLIRLRDNDIAVDEITVSKPSLDEVFLTLTGHGAEDDAKTERSVA
jgi:ABC-2 type transport system ATP-binding protein